MRKSNLDVEGRVIEFSGIEYMVRGRGYIKTLSDLEDIAVGTNSAGTPVYLKDIAVIKLGPEIRRGVAELDGKGEVAGGIVVVRFGENVLNVIDRVKAKIAREIVPSLPKGVKVVVTYDRSDLIRHAIGTLKEEIIKLTVAVSVVCIIFLFHLPSALVVILTLPIAIIMSFICMYYLKVTSNIMSLSGIAIAIGAMVDASIIMVENAHKKLEEWEDSGRQGSRTDVIIEAAKEVGPSLFFSLLVITVGFLPCLYASGPGRQALYASRVCQNLCHALLLLPCRDPDTGPHDSLHQRQDKARGEEPCKSRTAQSLRARGNSCAEVQEDRPFHRRGHPSYFPSTHS